MFHKCSWRHRFFLITIKKIASVIKINLVININYSNNIVVIVGLQIQIIKVKTSSTSLSCVIVSLLSAKQLIREMAEVTVELFQLLKSVLVWKDIKVLRMKWGERWLGFPDLWSGQKPWWNWYLTPVVNFGEVQRAQLAKYTLLTSTMGPLGSFKVYSDAKESVECRKQRENTAPIHP